MTIKKLMACYFLFCDILMPVNFKINRDYFKN